MIRYRLLEYHGSRLWMDNTFAKSIDGKVQWPHASITGAEIAAITNYQSVVLYQASMKPFTLLQSDRKWHAIEEEGYPTCPGRYWGFYCSDRPDRYRPAQGMGVQRNPLWWTGRCWKRSLGNITPEPDFWMECPIPDPPSDDGENIIKRVEKAMG